MPSETEKQIASISAVLLCAAAGATDVLSYLTLGQIFTSAMTGCAALFFVKLAGGQYATVVRAGTALASYFIGCALAASLQPRDQKLVKTPFTLRRLLLAESVLLAAYCVVSAGAHHPLSGAPREALIFISATAMGLQSIVAQDLAEPGVSTVVLNPTMTSLGLAVTKLLMGREPRLPRVNRLQIIVLAAYAAAAVLCAFAVVAHVRAADWLPLVLVLAVLGLQQAACFNAAPQGVQAARR